MGYAVTHLDETLPATWNVLSDSFINDVINGDLESGTRWFSYTLTQIGLGLIGGKGLDKVSKLAKGTNFTVKSAKYIPNIYNNPEPALAGVQAVSKPVPYNVIDDNKLLSQINSEVDKVYGSGKETTKSKRILGQNGTQLASKTTWQKGKTERIDVENPSPGERPIF